MAVHQSISCCTLTHVSTGHIVTLALRGWPSVLLYYTIPVVPSLATASSTCHRMLGDCNTRVTSSSFIKHIAVGEYDNHISFV